MERGQRIGLILAAVVVAVVGIVLISSRGGDDDDSGSSGTATTETQPGEPTASVPAPKPRPEFETIRLGGGEVRGGEQEITVSKGDVARIEVRSDAPDEIHLHGYDVYKDVAPGKPARFRVKANAEGIFELEAHELGHVTIGTLVVEP
jgi:hypothetical protein